MPESSITPLPPRTVQADTGLCFHQALAGSHRAWSFAVLQTPRGTLGRSFGPCWCFGIPVRHGGCLGRLHSWVPAPPHWRCALGAPSPALHTQDHEMHQLRGL